LIPRGKVSVRGLTSPKASSEVADSAEITVSGELYVARSAGKLAAALDSFGVEVPEICLDIGASTGGFTQVLLERGASKVLAVDVGHDQLAAELRENPKVVNLEGHNVREMVTQDLGLNPEVIGLVVADLSFISLTMVAHKFSELAPKASVVALIKPQFELQRSKLNKAGIVADAADRQLAIEGVLSSFAAAGYGAQALTRSSVIGSHGNQEYLALFSPASVAEISAAEIAGIV